MPTLNTAISPPIQVSCLTKGDVVGTNFTGNVTVSLGTNPTGATLGGTKTVAAVAGVATFNNLTLNRSGKNFVMRAAASGLKTASSDPFTIATELVFTVQPSSAAANALLNPVEVTVEDSAGNTDAQYAGVVTIAKYSGPGILSGTVTAPAVAGVATFGNLRINAAGDYTLIAVGSTVTDCYTPASKTSNSFAIGAYTLTAANLGGSSAFGFVTGLGGSISPATLSGQTIYALESTIATSVTAIVLTGIFAQNLFTSLTVGATTRTTASATFSTGGGQTIWSWPATILFPSAAVYPVSIG